MTDLPSQGEPTRRGAKFWSVAVLVVLAIVFIALNSKHVDINFVFATVNTSLVFALAIATVLGVLIGWLGARFRHRG